MLDWRVRGELSVGSPPPRNEEPAAESSSGNDVAEETRRFLDAVARKVEELRTRELFGWVIAAQLVTGGRVGEYGVGVVGLEDVDERSLELLGVAWRGKRSRG